MVLCLVCGGVEELQLVKVVEALTARALWPGKPPSTKEELLQRYVEDFTGRVHHIHLDPAATPGIHACRNVPLSIMDPLKKTLKDLQERKVITPVSEPTEWVNSLVMTKKKNGALRVCLDPCNLNQAASITPFLLPNVFAAD
ncbi:hypothetical protein NHX12_014766 [Muraenolepis orangiensis]|uniref:Uncharacterized protein n=1 Tax=Muraenolepis orangiensis TaxID=630683 RepID=A0A9Q0DC12_9TELE|nr:hypothetical protein NHX12_014766 [Muraenolepis orangiensis]